jgi:hypothetical protein
MKEREPAPPNLDFTVNPDDEEMYFKEAGQLLLVYQALEESNLFYIQNAQAGGGQSVMHSIAQAWCSGAMVLAPNGHCHIPSLGRYPARQ